MTRPIPHRSLEHVYRPARTDPDVCHWCSLPPIYHQKARRQYPADQERRRRKAAEKRRQRQETAA